MDRLEELINLKGLQIRPELEDMDENLTAYQRLSRIGDEVLEHLVGKKTFFIKFGKFYHKIYNFPKNWQISLKIDRFWKKIY